MNQMTNDDLIHAFLQQTRDQLPERSYAAVRGQIEHTPQRVVLGRWRTPLMNDISRYFVMAAAAAVIAVAALVGFNYVTKPVTPAVTPAATPTLAPTPSPVALTPASKGNVLQPGTYSATIPYRVTYQFTPPSGWTFDDLGTGRLSLFRTTTDPNNWVNNLVLASVKSTYPDPCNPGDGPVPVGQTVPEIVQALTTQPGLRASVPQAAQFVGANGMSFTVDSEIDDPKCSGDGTIHQMRDPSDFDIDFIGDHQRIWVISTGTGNPLVMQLSDFPWTTGPELNAAEDFVSTFRFTPAQ